MKINYLLYSVAIASAFAACSDELSEVAVKAPANEALAGRPVVGEVVLSVNKAETRLTDKGVFEQGDKVKLFLMDEFELATEEQNANMTPWKTQERWWQMYDMVDYIQSNYPYVFDGEDFVNPAAQLVEGNYVAYYQENQDYRTHDMTNRRDLWSFIKPVVTLEQKSANVYANMENDFYLDYQQFYRDEDATAEGKIVKDMALKPVLNRVHFIIGNLNNAQYRIRRISINRRNNAAVPTIAYVRPDSYRNWSDEKMNDNLHAGFDWTDKKFTEHKVYDSWAGDEVIFHTYNGGKKSFTQDDAREITYFESTAIGHVPYGLSAEDAAPAYEYAIEFPGEGHLLNAHAPFTSTERVDAYFAIPVFAEDFVNYEIRVDGDYRDITLGEASDPGDWTPGYWCAPAVVTPNTKWKMEKAFDHNWLASMGSEWPTGTLTVDFNDMHLYKEETSYVTIQNTEELINKLAADGEAGNVNTYINLDGVGIEFNDAVKALIKSNADAIAAQNVPGKEYHVWFTESISYNEHGQQESSDEIYGYGDSWIGDEYFYWLNQMANLTTVLNVTAEDVFDLPTNIYNVSATYNADQHITSNINFVRKNVVNAHWRLGYAAEVVGGQPIVFLNGSVVSFYGNNSKLLNILVPQPNAVVTVNTIVDNMATNKITGVNNGKVILPRTDVYNLVGGEKVWIGFNHHVDDLELVNTNINANGTDDGTWYHANGGIKFYPANGKEIKDTKNVPYYTAVDKLNHTADYKILTTDGVESVKVDDGKVTPYEPEEPGVAPNYPIY